MIDPCMTALETILLGMGYRKVHTDLSDLVSFAGGVPSCYVYQAEPSELTRDRRRVALEDNPNEVGRTVRYRLYGEKLSLIVRLVDVSRSAVDARKVQFLQELPTRILDGGGNAIDVAATGAIMVEDKSVLGGKTAMEIAVEFTGGVYKDEVIPLVTARADQVEIER